MKAHVLHVVQDREISGQSLDKECITSGSNRYSASICGGKIRTGAGMGLAVPLAVTLTAVLLIAPSVKALRRGVLIEIPDIANRTLPPDVEPLQSKLGFACFYPSDPPAAGPSAYHGNRPLGARSVVPHGGLVRFHCAVQQYYQLVGPEAVLCIDGAFNETLPTCERAFLERRLVVSVKGDYVLGPGGLYVVPPDAPVEITCRRTMGGGGGRPTWQWDANLDVFIKESTFFTAPTSTIRMNPVDGSHGLFICSDGNEEVMLSLEARGDRCPRPPLDRNLLMRSNTLRAEFACSRGLLLGPLSVRCQSFRRWDLVPPTCFVAEGCPSSAQGGEQGPRFPCVVPELATAVEAFDGNRRVVSGDAVAPGDSIRFHCEPVGGFKLLGEPQLSCVDGRWSDKPPVCGVSSPHTLSVTLNFPHAVAPGGVVHVLPYTEVNMVCTSNDPGLPPKWTMEAEVNATATENPGYRHSTSYLRFTAPQAGLEGSFTCRSNPQGGWAESRTVHVRVREHMCPVLKPPRGLRMRANFDMAVFECEPPGQLVGSPLLQCQPFGDWDYSMPQCLRPGRVEECPVPVQRPRVKDPAGVGGDEEADAGMGGGVSGVTWPDDAEGGEPLATPENSPPLRSRNAFVAPFFSRLRPAMLRPLHNPLAQTSP
ncbi:complement receptor type 2-like isoform X1 [Dermacentor albipictus]|uniref:complement receptor type 2-like isoform X1 n=2 Tax=Dermacentor albipictus TaxID=60249 RepID=UPI0038FCC24E